MEGSTGVGARIGVAGGGGGGARPWGQPGMASIEAWRAGQRRESRRLDPRRGRARSAGVWTRSMAESRGWGEDSRGRASRRGNLEWRPSKLGERGRDVNHGG
jgi:hypothetical protein